MPLNKTDLKEIGKLLKSQQKAINQDIGNLIGDQILPQFDSLNDQFEGVNRKMDALFERGDRQEKRITKLEKVSPLIT